MSIRWSQALSWRLRRHLLDPIGGESVAGVVGRLTAVPTVDAAAAELAVRTRRQRSRPGEVARALAEGRIISTFAFRGAVNLMTPADGGAYLALRAAGRQWELPSWQSYYELTPSDWPRLRETVRDALADGPLTRDELGATVTRKAAYRHLRPVFDDGAGTLLKPLAWQGDMSFGPPRDGQATFQRLDDNPRWAGIWDLDEAGPHAIASYFRAYGPATPDHIQYWLGNGLSAGRKRLQSWLAGLADRLVAVDVDGERAYVLSEDLDELMTAQVTMPCASCRVTTSGSWVRNQGRARGAARSSYAGDPQGEPRGQRRCRDRHVVDPARRGRGGLVRGEREAAAGRPGGGGRQALHHPRSASRDDARHRVKMQFVTTTRESSNHRFRVSVDVRGDPPGRDLGAGPDAEAEADAFEVTLGGAFVDPEPLADLAVDAPSATNAATSRCRSVSLGGVRPRRAGRPRNS